MKKTLPFLALITAVCVSCNSVRLPFKSTERVRIISENTGSIVYNQDTLVLHHQKKDFLIKEHYNQILKVSRSNKPLNFRFIGEDSLVKDYVIMPKNLIPTYKDQIPDRNYSYATKINPVLLPSKDTIELKAKSFKRPEKGSIYLNASLPFANFHNFASKNQGRVSASGVFGFSLGLDYYHSKNHFFNLTYSTILSIPLTIYESFDDEYVDSETSLWSNYFSFSNNHRVGRLTLGYGLSFAENNYHLPRANREKYYALGNVFLAYVQLSKAFHLGVIYKPTYYRPQLSDKFKYEHSINIDFMWKIRLK